ncbi:myoneurin-like [Trichogramma pretiosum]|uniref:myoneurin-like n=1 Tax=Trichogramma pretiosum TaxID=7493 RepID=UPI0006C993AC|nr:myoneurin-like [Trichogramma pretiosum]
MDVQEEFDEKNNSLKCDENISMHLDDSLLTKRTSERIKSQQMNKPIVSGRSTPIVSGRSTPIVSGRSTPISIIDDVEKILSEERNFTPIHQCIKIFKCSECVEDKTFVSFEEFGNHVLKTHEKALAFKRLFTCNKCQAVYLRNVDLFRHFSFEHLNVKVLKCKDCGAKLRKQTIHNTDQSSSEVNDQKAIIEMVK